MLIKNWIGFAVTPHSKGTATFPARISGQPSQCKSYILLIFDKNCFPFLQVHSNLSMVLSVLWTVLRLLALNCTVLFLTCVSENVKRTHVFKTLTLKMFCNMPGLFTGVCKENLSVLWADLIPVPLKCFVWCLNCLLGYVKRTCLFYEQI